MRCIKIQANLLWNPPTRLFPPTQLFKSLNCSHLHVYSLLHIYSIPKSNWTILICKIHTTWRLILQTLTKLATLHNFSRICNEIIPDLHSCLKQSQWLHELKVYSHVGYGVCVDSKKSVESFNSCSGHIPNF